jgi:predicted CoA-binding protein
MSRLTTDDEIRALLDTAKHIAVVGYSDDESKPSNEVAHELRRLGYQVTGVSPTAKGTETLKVYPTLADVPTPIDVVDIFRRADAMLGVVQEAIAVKAKTVWMQLGLVNEEAAQAADAAGLGVVMDRCMKMEHHRLYPEE